MQGRVTTALAKQSDPPTSDVRRTHPARAAEESLAVDAMQKILDAFTTFSTEIRGDIADLSSKVDVAAARETAAKDRTDRLEKELNEHRVLHTADVKELHEKHVKHEVSIVKVYAYAAGAGAVASGFISIGIALALKLFH